MALANVAWILAATGNRVLVIDWDLEAPGLHRYFLPFLSDPNFVESPGLLEIFEDYVRLIQEPTTNWPPGLTDPLYLADVRRHAVPLNYDFPDAACLHVLAAGAQNETYARRLQEFNWRRFYNGYNGAEFLKKFGAICREYYDHILIDSRTGVADTAGITTVELPDQVVLCFTYNRQSVEGVAAVGKTLVLNRKSFRKILPVPMRVLTDSKGIDRARDFARGHIAFLLKKYPPRHVDSYWENAEIGHYADYGFAETLAAFAEIPGRRQGLLADMLWLTAELTDSSDQPVLPRVAEKTRQRVLRGFMFADPIRAKLAEIISADLDASPVAALRELIAQLKNEETGDEELWKEIAAGAMKLAQGSGAMALPEEALAATEEAVAVYRELAAARPDAHLPELAMSLNNLGNRLSDLGRREDALAATEEALTVYRELAAARPDAFKPDLATSLNNLGNALSGLGRREDALHATEEAVTVYRELAAARPHIFKANLAMSLNNLGNRLSALGRREGALQATEESVALRRELAAARPDAFKPDLAMSLNNLGAMLNALGRREDALAATEEAVALRRELAAARPDAFKLDLAGGLNNLGVSLSDLGRREDALPATEEAVTLHRELAAARPEAFKPDLAMSLTNLGIRLNALGRCEDALAATEEAVALRRELAAARPDAFKPDLAKSLNSLGAILYALGRREDALAATEEAVALRRELAAARPDAFKPDLASALNNLGAILHALGRREDALAATEEAVALRRELAAARPDAFLADLAMSLSNLADCHDERGNAEVAIRYDSEAIATMSGPFLALPTAHANMMMLYIRDYRTRCEKLGVEPDAELLEPIDEVFQALQAPRPSAGRSPMSAEATMAATAVAAVVPYLVEAGKEGAKTLGKEAAAGAVRVLAWLRGKLTPGGQAALARLEQTPDDADRQAALRVALKDLLADEQTLKDNLAKLLDTIPKAAIDQNLVQQGDHNRAAQIAGDSNKVDIR
jgi:tetratricopeptide (TPR) repeat protein